MTKKKQVRLDWRIAIAAIAGLTIIECVAMSKGINGTFRMVITALIAGITGVTIDLNAIAKIFRRNR